MTAAELKTLEDSLWAAATTLRNSSGLKSNEYSTPILGIVFLRYLETLYAPHAEAIEVEYKSKLGKRNETEIEKIAIKTCGFYLPNHARYDYLLKGEYKREEKNLLAREALQKAMRSVEQFNELSDTLPINEYEKLSSENIEDLLKKFSEIPLSAETDVFGKIYEFFLGEFALGEGQKGGEFYTPPAVVRLMVEVIEPKGGKLLDPACGSGGMFVQSANYLRKNYPELLSQLTVYGFEKSKETARLARMNTKINGVRSFIEVGNTFESKHKFVREYDYVLANPPFNVKEVKAVTVEEKQHFNEYGLPKNKGKAKGEELIPNANYLWISLFAAALKPGGRAALVMANPASNGSGTELEMRKRLVEQGMISAMLTLSGNMFNTVTLPATLWFFERAKETSNVGEVQNLADVKVLFVDARNIFTQLTRKQRTFTKEQVQNIATIFRLRRGETQRYHDLLVRYQCKADKFERKAKDFYPKVLAAKKELEALQQKLETAKKPPAVQKPTEKERDKREKEIARAERDCNRQQKELEILEVQHASLLKRRDYFLQHRDWLTSNFPDGKYRDVTGLCKLASLDEIAEQNYSLNPGRYVGVVIEQDGLTAEEYADEMKGYHDELAQLQAEAHKLENRIGLNYAELFHLGKLVGHGK